jgi:uncharacterized membrane protein
VPAVSAEASPALLDLQAAVDAVVRDDGLVLSPKRLVSDAEILVTSTVRLQAKLVHTLRAAWASDAIGKIDGKPAKSWLTEDLRMSPKQAGRLVYLSMRLDSFPRTEAAFDAGDITVEHASLIVRTLLTLPPELRDILEETLLKASGEAPAPQVAKMVDELLEAMGYDKESDARRERRHADRGFDLHASAFRVYAARGNLTPEVAELLRLALDVAGAKAGDDDDRSPRQRRHDALGLLAEHFLAHADLPALNGERPRVVVTIRWEDLMAADGVRAFATMGADVKISVEAARRLCCDAGVLPVVLGGKGEVLDVGRASRTFTMATKRAAWFQQGGKCAFPRCSRPIIECHHIVHWSAGGHSSLDNAAWLCAYHHWLVHEGKWTMRKDDRGYTFTNPYGAERHRCPEAA